MLLHHTAIGQGQPVVILHGLLGCADNWLPIAQKISNSFRIICTDLRNHGRSPHAPTHTYADMANDVAETLDALNIERTHILGHSMGGQVAAMLWQMQPQRIDRLVLADIAPLIPPSTAADAHLNNHQQTLLALQALNLSQLRSFAQADALLATTITNTRLRQSMLKNLARERNGQFSHRLNINVLLQYLPEIIQGVSSNNLPAHTLLLRGEYSNYVSDNDIIRTRKLCPTLTEHKLPNAGHWLHVDCPQLVVEHTLAFLRT